MREQLRTKKCFLCPMTNNHSMLRGELVAPLLPPSSQWPEQRRSVPIYNYGRQNKQRNNGNSFQTLYKNLEQSLIIRW